MSIWLAVAIILIGTIAIVNAMYAWHEEGEGLFALGVFFFTLIVLSIFSMAVYWLVYGAIMMFGM